MKMIQVISLSLVILTKIQLIWCGECYEDTQCSPILGCPLVYQLAFNVRQDPEGSLLRRNMVNHVRDRICGDREERMVCCPLLEQKIKIGSFVNLHHQVTGDILAMDSHTLVLRNFTYDGTAPDAFFIAGSSSLPGSVEYLTKI